MRDRLQELMLKAKDMEESRIKEDTGDEAGDIQQHAVVFEREPVIERYLHEIRKIQNDITDLSDNVTKFGQQQKVLISTMRRFSVLKKESNVTQDIKVQAERIKNRLDTLSQEVHITKGQLTEIEQRHKELVSLENQIKDLRDIFLQISFLVEEQGETLNNIEMATRNTEDYVQKTNEKFKLAVKYKKKNPCKSLFCCCCPCC
ncbi:hypothetical protein GDO81_006885 [Engystomops pustulosus]|uniref:t-SNARE coiled-coil homology domain-containing protein n=1 Tax=Engystomops pustulosus TaxID=76066 RepID=A0AAV7D1Z5_ENGPU|nr:hypothetical protein GDO81_006885 [Engystomops pustulosus]